MGNKDKKNLKPINKKYFEENTNSIYTSP